ncbi:MAG: tyrosine-type recombinase/integrase [Clostridiaceae bacterium]|nr:tyrosine-type recombinase/integrase [Clostridiaceae bacterium]
MIDFVMNTGARIGEALRATDKDFNNGHLTLWTRKNKLGNLQPRTIAYTPDFAIPAGRTFPEWTSYPRFLEDKCKQAKVKPFSWHCLRHLRASQLIQEGWDLVKVRDYLGHADVTTSNIYLQSLDIRYELATENSQNLTQDFPDVPKKE